MYQDPPLASRRGTLDRHFSLTTRFDSADSVTRDQILVRSRPCGWSSSADRQIILDRLPHEQADFCLGETCDDIVLWPAIDELANQMRRYFAVMSVDKECHFENEIPVGAGPFMYSWPGWR